MSLVCTCGAELPPDARFCHKCGKPQRDEPAFAGDDSSPSFQLPLPPIEPGPDFSKPDFHNPVAIRVAWIAASLSTLLNLALFLGFAVWLFSAGFLSSYLFSRRTSKALTVRSGARMGWLTGLLNFVMMTVLFTISVMSIASRPGGLSGFYREQFSQMGASTPNMDEAIRMLDSAGGLAMMFLMALFVMFSVIMFFCTAGGALGAKVMEKE
jgi:hypothetical protein